jgi:hypothetical protein
MPVSPSAITRHSGRQINHCGDEKHPVMGFLEYYTLGILLQSSHFLILCPLAIYLMFFR